MLGFEDLAWLFPRYDGDERQREINVEEAALLWKAIKAHPGNILEVGRRRGATTCIVAAAAPKRMLVSHGQERALAADVASFLTKHDLNLHLEVRTGEFSTEQFVDDAQLILFQEGVSTDHLLSDILCLWPRLERTRGRAPLVAVLFGGECVGGVNSSGIEAWNQMSDFLIDSGAAELVADVGRLHLLRGLGPLAADTYLRAANLLRDSKKQDLAHRVYEASLNMYDDNSSIWHEFGRLLLNVKKYEESERALRRSLDLRECHHCLNNMGLCLLRQGRAEDAMPNLQRSLKIEPTYTHALNNLGWVYEELGELEKAEALHRRAIVETPDYVMAHYNLGRMLVSRGKLSEGWRKYEWRWRVPDFPSEKRPYEMPQWNGEDLQGKSILLWGEQGVADEIMYASMIPDLVALGARGVIECAPKLVPLFQMTFPQFTVYPRQNPPFQKLIEQSFDFQAPFASLAIFLRDRIERFPSKSDFWNCNPKAVALWKKRLSEVGPGLKVGIGWSSKNLTGARKRLFLNIEDLGPVLQASGCTFICMQYGDCDADIEKARKLFGVEIVKFDALDLLNDIHGTFAMAKSLDVGVAPAGSPLTMMAANGVPVLSPAYLRKERNLGTKTIPWYPSVRVFPCDYGQPLNEKIGEVATELEGVLQQG